MEENNEIMDTNVMEILNNMPGELIEHRDVWSGWYGEEEQELRKVFDNGKIKNNKFKINHIGSTSIKKIAAREIIDVMVEIPETIDIDTVREVLSDNNYTFISEKEGRMNFIKGVSKDSREDKVFQIFIRYIGDNGELYFRDYLKDNDDMAKEYEELKRELIQKYTANSKEYMNLKREFVDKYTDIAKKKYGYRH